MKEDRLNAEVQMNNRQKGKTSLRKDDLHLFLRSDCDVSLCDVTQTSDPANHMCVSNDNEKKTNALFAYERQAP